MSHPYQGLSQEKFWYKAMTIPPSGHIDPVTHSIQIRNDEKISTLGSCFAQNISKNLKSSGFNYYVSENAPSSMELNLAQKLQYGTFSARYGNIYTARQALQLFDRAYGNMDTGSHAWKKKSKYIDPFRPQTQPNGYSSLKSMLMDREKHLEYVKDVFEKSDWFFFTLGLTEAWRSVKHGYIYPLAPGVSGGEYNKKKHEFINFSIKQVVEDLKSFIKKIIIVNPKSKFILTVSPVPLVATFENRHVLVSTTLSKSILRLAINEVEEKFSNVIYFPSYEIITSPAIGSGYFKDDLRQVTNLGVNHVIRIFKKHFLRAKDNIQINDNSEIKKMDSNYDDDIICDEEEIENALKKSGF